jgi:glutathione S-transferase
MRLIGMLDSPYVRRVAISLEFLGVPFRHEPVSVFSTFEQFHAVNPVVKAPSLVCEDGTVLMDSSLILQFIEATKAGGGSLWSRHRDALQHEVRAVSLALAACDKSAQMIYERNLRPPHAQYEPWLERVQGQLLAACAGLEAEVRGHEAAFANPGRQASITAAVAWQFIQSMLAAVVPERSHPALAQLSARMEGTPAFRRHPPDGPGVQPPAA